MDHPAFFLDRHDDGHDGLLHLQQHQLLLPSLTISPAAASSTTTSPTAASSSILEDDHPFVAGDTLRIPGAARNTRSAPSSPTSPAPAHRQHRRYHSEEDELILPAVAIKQPPKPALSVEDNPLLDEIIEYATSKAAAFAVHCAHGHEQALQAHLLPEYIKDVIERSKTSFPVVIAGLVYLERFERILNGAGKDLQVHACPHKLFLACLVLACKYAHDATYKNSTWTRLGQKVLSLEGLNRLEMLILRHFDFNMRVTNKDLNDFLVQNFKFEGRPRSPRRWYQFLEDSWTQNPTDPRPRPTRIASTTVPCT